MELTEAMSARHAVRDYSDRPIDEATTAALRQAIAHANDRGALHIQLIHDDEDAFGGCPTHYGRFNGVRYCIALVGQDSGADGGDLDRRVGYWGQWLALQATMLGLDTSWVVLHDTETHGRWRIGTGERMPAAIALGHGARTGRAHRSKPIDELGATRACAFDEAPAWFVDALRAVQLAPSALGRQPVRFTLLDDGRTVRAEALDGVQPMIALGIATLHFEIGAGQDVLWEDSDVGVWPSWRCTAFTFAPEATMSDAAV